MPLSSLIVQREVASIRQVEEALARQVLYGGDLATNLLEVVQLPEKVLLPLLAEDSGLTAAPVGMLPPPSAQARALVPEDVASRRVVMPLAVEGGRLVLAVSEGLPTADREELETAFGLGIEERIAPSVRIREALARVYGVPLDRRMSRLVGRLAGVDPTVPNSLPPLRAPKASAPPLPGALSHDLPKLNPPGMPVLGTLRLPESRDDEGEEKKKESARPAPKPSILPSILREAKGTGEAPRRRGPVTLERVTEELGRIRDREGLLHLFFDFGRQFFEYSAIFVVHNDIAEGRDSFGNGAPRDRVLALGVPLDMPSILRTVRERGVLVCAYPELGGLDAVLMSDLKRDARSKLLVVPLVVRSRVVAFFIADDGAAGIDPTAQGELTTVAALIGREFERLIVRIKLGGFTGEAASEERRVDPRRVEPKRRRAGPEARDAAAHALEQVVATSTLSVPSPSAPPAAPSPSAPPPPSASPSAPPPAPDEAASPASLEPLPAPVGTQPSTRPGELRPGALPAPASPTPRAYKTLRNFLVPREGRAGDDDVTDKAPPVEPVEPAEETRLAPLAPPPRSSPPADEARDEDSSEPSPASLRPVPRDLSDRPPPPQAAAVRRPSGRPIPREETDEEGSPVSSTRFAETISSRPPPADVRQARRRREADAATAQFMHAPPSARVPSPASMRSGQAVTLPPHAPPSGRTHQPLPSVIVDVELQTERLVEAFLESPRDDQVEAELLRLGQAAMPAIMKHFPGPITIRRETLDDTWPRVSECGPILRLIAGQRRVALPFVLWRTDDQDTETRFWATYLLTELAYVEAVPAVVARLFDDSKRVRRAARLCAHVLGDVAGAALVAELDRIVRDPKGVAGRRVVTLDALGEMRDPLVVPVLLGTLADDDEDVALAARRALMLVSRQDFGRDTRKWIAWWQASMGRHRIEWLIDALTHEVPALRRAAGQELKALTEQYFGYYDDLPKKDRERAQQKYREWWKAEGQAHFRKA